MPTPMFKVLAQSLRLGQPPDATSAVRVLVEAIEKQSAEIDDLRAKLSIANSRIQYAEARLGRIIEATEPDLARDDSPPSSHAAQSAQQPQSPHAAGPPAGQVESSRASQRPPPMPPAHSPPSPHQQAPQAAPMRSPSVRPPAIPHALPIPQAPSLPQGLANPHPPLNIPQPMPLPQMSQQLAQMAQPPMPQVTPPRGLPATPRSPAVPTLLSQQQKPPMLHDLVDDGGFDEFNQTLVINKRDVLQVARAEAPFPLGRGPERQRAHTAATPFQPALQPTPPVSSPPLSVGVRSQAEPATSPAARPERPPVADGTKTGLHAYRPSPDDPRAVLLARAAQIASDRAALASIIDEAEEAGSNDDFTLTDQTARVDLSGLTELEQRAAERKRADRDGD